MPEQGALMEFVRGTLTPAAAGTYEELEIATPPSRSEKLAVLIWRLELSLGVPETSDTNTTDILAHWASATQTAIILENDPECLMVHQRVVRAGDVAGTLTEFIVTAGDNRTEVALFQPPILYAKDSLFLGIDTTNQASVKQVIGRVGYTLERVPAELFIAALVE